MSKKSQSLPSFFVPLMEMLSELSGRDWYLGGATQQTRILASKKAILLRTALEFRKINKTYGLNLFKPVSHQEAAALEIEVAEPFVSLWKLMSPINFLRQFGSSKELDDWLKSLSSVTQIAEKLHTELTLAASEPEILDVGYKSEELDNRQIQPRAA